MFAMNETSKRSNERNRYIGTPYKTDYTPKWTIWSLWFNYIAQEQRKLQWFIQIGSKHWINFIKDKMIVAI